MKTLYQIQVDLHKKFKCLRNLVRYLTLPSFDCVYKSLTLEQRTQVHKIIGTENLQALKTYIHSNNKDVGEMSLRDLRQEATRRGITCSNKFPRSSLIFLIERERRNEARITKSPC